MKTTGTVGGIQPLAAAGLYETIAILQGYIFFNKHIRMIIDNNINIPDRTKPREKYKNVP